MGVVDAPEIRSPRTLTRSLVQPFGMSVNEMRVGFFFSSSPSRPAPPNSVDMAPSTVRCDSSRLCLCRTGLKCLFFVFFCLCFPSPSAHPFDCFDGSVAVGEGGGTGSLGV